MCIRVADPSMFLAKEAEEGDATSASRHGRFFFEIEKRIFRNDSHAFCVQFPSPKTAARSAILSFSRVKFPCPDGEEGFGRKGRNDSALFSPFAMGNG